MKVQLSAAALDKVPGDWLIVPVFESNPVSGPAAEVDAAVGGALSRLHKAGDLTGKLAEIVALRDAPGISAKRLLVVGLGKAESLTRMLLDKTFSMVGRQISDKKDVKLAVLVPDVLERDVVIETITTSLIVASVGQDLYRSDQVRFPFAEATLVLAGKKNDAAAKQAAEKGRILGESMNLTRELVNTAPDDIYPASFAERAKEVAGEFGLKCEVLDEKRLVKERMGSLLAVAKGSDKPPRVVVLRYDGAKQGPTIALVGKGVTFDSGGLSIKPSDGMLTMKCDMAGASTVLGAMAAIARLKLPVKVVGYAGLVENMINGSSYKLGDVLKARNGTTIEVQNTDAEGRLVLADVLSYAVDHGADRIVDLATLTGACVVALGENVTGAFTNDETWCDELIDSAKTVGEDVWQLPMFDHYAELLKSDVADCKNIGGRWGGAITAAKFLEKFVGGKSWVHLDIAGPSFASSNTPAREGGATACMLRTLVELAGRVGVSGKK